MESIRLTRRQLLAKIPLATAGILLAGCGGTPQPTPQATVKPSPPATAPVAAPTTAPTAAKAPLALKTAVESFGGGQLDPTMASSNDGTLLLRGMFDLSFESSDDGQLAPGIIKKWEISPDGLSWTFTVRDDVYFQDGVNADGTPAKSYKLTAADIKFSYERAACQTCLGSSNWRSVLGDPPRIEVIDDQTLRIFTKGKQPLLAKWSAGVPYLEVLPKVYIDKNGFEYFGKNPLGTGPYKFVSFKPGDVLEMQAGGRPYWLTGTVPQFTRVFQYQVPEENTRVAMLETGQIDVTPVSIDTALKLKAKGYRIGNARPGYISFLFPGRNRTEAKNSPVSDARVIKALSFAINRPEIIKTLLGGLGDVPAPPASGWLFGDLTPALKTKWKAWVDQNYRYDPTEAKRLLKEAGYSGQSFDFWYVPDAAAPFMKDVATAAIGYWAEVGVKANFVNVERAAWEEAINTKKSLNMVGKVTCRASGIAEMSHMRKMASYTSKYGNEYLLDGMPTGEAEMDALYLDGLSAMDTPTTEKIVDKMLQVTTDAWVAFSVVQAPTTFAFGPRVAGELSPVVNVMSQFYGQWKYTGVEPKK